MKYLQLEQANNNNVIDIAMSAVYVSLSRIEEMDFTDTYMQIHPALIMKDYNKDKYTDMSKIKKDDTVARGKTVFFFYFLGLTNLMLGWAHHAYFIPTQPWIRFLAYGVSMTEWIVLFHIIYSWKKSLSVKEKLDNSMSYKFLIAADFWVFINIILALLISIPAINFFTHGTHITVAHSMGTTIGINTTILFASIFFIVSKLKNQEINFNNLKRSYYLFNGSLLLFLCSLLFAGAKRSNWMYFTKDVLFSEMQDSLYVTYIAFFVFGIGLVIAIILLSIVLLKPLIKHCKSIFVKLE